MYYMVSIIAYICIAVLKDDVPAATFTSPVRPGGTGRPNLLKKAP